MDTAEHPKLATRILIDLSAINPGFKPVSQSPRYDVFSLFRCDIKPTGYHPCDRGVANSTSCMEYAYVVGYDGMEEILHVSLSCRNSFLV